VGAHIGYGTEFMGRAEVLKNFSPGLNTSIMALHITDHVIDSVSAGGL
jgi:hypothetical protein